MISERSIKIMQSKTNLFKGILFWKMWRLMKGWKRWSKMTNEKKQRREVWLQTCCEREVLVAKEACRLV
jgi:hypothetical protein